MPKLLVPVPTTRSMVLNCTSKSDGVNVKSILTKNDFTSLVVGLLKEVVLAVSVHTDINRMVRLDHVGVQDDLLDTIG
jgi:hypothetical protein